MTTLLQLTTSLFGADGQSTRLARRFGETWRAAHPDGRVVVRDLAHDPVPHLDETRMRALSSQPGDRTPAQQAIVDESDALITEVRDADAIVIGLPLYNFGIPSTLKAWFDHVLRAGVTFRYTADGPVGLLGDRKVYVLAARGGYYHGTPADTQTPHVTALLNFIGLEDIEFVYAEGLNVSDAARDRALDGARSCVEKLAA